MARPLDADLPVGEHTAASRHGLRETMLILDSRPVFAKQSTAGFESRWGRHGRPSGQELRLGGHLALIPRSAECLGHRLVVDAEAPPMAHADIPRRLRSLAFSAIC